MTFTRSGKSHYTEIEAAHCLGLSLEDLRALVRTHIAQTEEEMQNLAITNLQASDLLLLRLITMGHQPPARPADPAPVPAAG